MELPYSVDELHSASMELLGVNGRPRPTCVRSRSTATGRSVSPRENPVDVVIVGWPWGTYLGEDALERGVRAKVVVEAGRAQHDPARSKATGVYLELDARRARSSKAGYEERSSSRTTDTSAMARARTSSWSRDGVIYTPDLSASILPGSRAIR